jgi:hypothetical protein
VEKKKSFNAFTVVSNLNFLDSTLVPEEWSLKTGLLLHWSVDKIEYREVEVLSSQKKKCSVHFKKTVD